MEKACPSWLQKEHGMEAHDKHDKKSGAARKVNKRRKMRSTGSSRVLIGWKFKAVGRC